VSQRARPLALFSALCVAVFGACSDDTGGEAAASGGSTSATGGATGGTITAPRGGSAMTGGTNAATGGAPPATGAAVNGATGGTSAATGGATGGVAPGGAANTGGTTAQAGQADAGAPGAGSGDPPNTECGRCAEYGTATETGTVQSNELNALSGVAVSRQQPEIVFAHNDHDRPVVYAIDSQGREHAQIVLTDAPATDIEDIAVGPCGAETCIYLGDVGDNGATRTEYAILRFVAPTVPATPGENAMTSPYERFRFTYEDGSHNAEGLMVSPDGTIYVVTKLAPGSGGNVAATGPSSVYRLPASITSDSVAVATKVATLPVPETGEAAASAAAAHPCGQGFLLRTYDKVYEFVTPSGMPFEAAFEVAPEVIELADEPQSEGIDYLEAGFGFVTSGEGSRAPIVETACAR
jgi:hypothetical protein